MRKKLNMERNKFYKHTLNELKGKLSNKKWIYLYTEAKIKKVLYNVDIEICRADLNFPGEKYKGETYFLRIERWPPQYPGNKGSSPLDEDFDFKTIEEVANYLDKNKILKKEEWIDDEK